MVRLDTVKFRVDNLGCILYNPDCFLTVTTYNKDVMQGRLLKLQDKYKPQGVSLLNIDLFNNHVTVELSAKVLMQDYLDGIHINNIEKVIDGLTVYKGNYYFKTALLDSAYLLRCDVTDNLYVSCADRYLKALEALRDNDRYLVDCYKGSVVFRSKAKSNRSRTLIYDKMSELKRDAHLYSVLLQHNKISDSTEILRVESNLRKFKQMRDCFNVDVDKCVSAGRAKCVRLIDALQSHEHVNYKLLKRVADVTLQHNNNNNVNYTGMRFQDIERLIGAESIVRDCNYDIELIKRFIREHVRGNISRYVARYKALIADMQEREKVQALKGDEKTDADYINEILRMLAG